MIRRPALWTKGASAAALALSLATGPAQAQLSSILAARASAPKPAAQGPGVNAPRSPTMAEALTRARATTSRAEQIRAYVLSARNAVVAANRGPVADGIATHGLDPTDAVRQAVEAARAGNMVRANELLVSASANLDPTGLKTWQGAGLPTQTTGTDGKILVTIDQTERTDSGLCQVECGRRPQAPDADDQDAGSAATLDGTGVSSRGRSSRVREALCVHDISSPRHRRRG